jgi:hypothetical protein
MATNRSALLDNPAFFTQLCTNISGIASICEANATNGPLHPYRDTTAGEVLVIMVKALMNERYGSRSLLQLAAFRGCYVGLLLEMMHCEDRVFHEPIDADCATVRGYYNKYLQRKPELQ